MREENRARDGDADVRAAVILLRQPSALRTRDQSAQLRDAAMNREADGVHRSAARAENIVLHLELLAEPRDPQIGLAAGMLEIVVAQRTRDGEASAKRCGVFGAG